MGSITTTGAVQGLVTFGSPGTIMRVRGEVQGIFTTGAAANSMKVLACGLIVVSAEALAAGVASIPSPAEDLNSPWFWHGFLLLARTTATEGDDDFMASHRVTIDSKAMRRVKPNESAVFVMDPIDLVGSEGAQLQFAARLLFAS